MSEITEITSQKKGDRLNIFLNGQFAFGVDYTTAVKFGLKKGVVLTEADLEAINEEEGNIAAFNRGLKYAVKKTVSEKQMLDYLVRNGYSPEASHAAIAKLKSYGYVDDAAYARAYVATYSSERGSKRMEFELKNAGLSNQIIAKVLEETSDSESCGRCMEKYLRTHKNADRQKLINYLLYRGFDWDDINDTIGRSGL